MNHAKAIWQHSTGGRPSLPAAVAHADRRKDLAREPGSAACQAVGPRTGCSGQQRGLDAP